MDAAVEISPTLTVNKKELAKKLRVSLPTLDRLIDEYQDFPISAGGSTGRPYEFDLAAVDEFLGSKRDAEEAAIAERLSLFDGLDLTSVQRGDAAGMTPGQQLSAVRVQRELRKMRQEDGFLVDVSELRMALSGPISDLVSMLDGLPDRMGRRFNLPVDVTEAMRSEIDEERRKIHAAMMESLNEKDADGALFDTGA